MALQQPSMNNLAAGLQAVSQELVLFQNIPAVVDARQLREAIQELDRRMNARFDEVLHQLQQQQTQLHRLQEGVNGVCRELDLQPMRLHNASASFMGTYRGPDGLIPGDYPNDRDALLAATAQQCIALSQYLRLPPLPNNSTVQQRKEQITKFLGISKLAG